jgi:hypothetical protein
VNSDLKLSDVGSREKHYIELIDLWTRTLAALEAMQKFDAEIGRRRPRLRDEFAKDELEAAIHAVKKVLTVSDSQQDFYAKEVDKCQQVTFTTSRRSSGRSSASTRKRSSISG